jgi:hypothetical protein
MDIRQALLAEHSKRQTAAIVEYIGDDARRFAELMKLFFAGDYRLTQRAAWPMNYCAERHPQLIQPYLPKLLACLERDDMHVAAKRNIVRLLQYIEIPRRLHGRVYGHCVDLLVNPAEPIAVRVFAMTAAARVAQTQPALLNELRLIVRQQMPHSTPAFQARAHRLLANGITDENDEHA